MRSVDASCRGQDTVSVVRSLSSLSVLADRDGDHCPWQWWWVVPAVVCLLLVRTTCARRWWKVLSFRKAEYIACGYVCFTTNTFYYYIIRYINHPKNENYIKNFEKILTNCSMRTIIVFILNSKCTKIEVSYGT